MMQAFYMPCFCCEYFLVQVARLIFRIHSPFNTNNNMKTLSFFHILPCERNLIYNELLGQT